MLIIVDTPVGVDFLHGNTNPETTWLDHELGHQEIGLTGLILCEILQGVRSDTSHEILKTRLLEFPIFAAGGKEIALQQPGIFAGCKKRFHGAQNHRLLHRTLCIRAGFSLVHRDRGWLFTLSDKIAW